MEKEKIIAYKGFDNNLCCRGFQFKVGEEYEQQGEIKCCKNGFHACANPFDVLDYYDVDKKNRFCQVEQYGIIDNNKEDTKQASSKIKIKAEIGMTGLFKAGIEWIKEKTNPIPIINETKDKIDNTSGDYTKIGSSGYSTKIGLSGDSAKIGSSGYYAQIGSSGYYAQIGSSGYSAKIGSIGNSAQIGSSGNYAKIGSIGDYAKIGSSGNSAKIGSSGNTAKIGSSGYSVQIGSSGNSVKIGSSGNSAKIGASGNYAQIGSSGDSAKIGTSGYSAKIGSSGDSAKIDSTGEDSVICCAGDNSMAKAKKGSWITLSEWKYSEEKKHYIPVCVKTEFVDGERIKEDTWYKLVNGNFEEQ